MEHLYSQILIFGNVRNTASTKMNISSGCQKCLEAQASISKYHIAIFSNNWKQRADIFEIQDSSIDIWTLLYFYSDW